MSSAYERDSTADDLLAEVLEDFKDYFAVDAGDVVCVIKTKGYMSEAASIRIIPDVYKGFVGKKLLITINGKTWDEFTSPDYRYALLFHELSHVVRDERGKIKLRKHEVEDFYILIKALGLDWENITDAKDKLRKTLDEAIAQQNL